MSYPSAGVVTTLSASSCAAVVIVACSSLLAGAPRAQTRPPQGVSGRGVILGKVLDTRDAPVVRARVDLNSDALPRGTGYPSLSLLTNEDGEFVFSGLPAGAYSISARKSGYREGVLERDASGGRRYGEISLADGQRLVDLRFRMRKYATVTGTVTDEIGAPVRSASVAAFCRQMVAGRAEWVGHGSQTDDRGVYRSTGLEPGPCVFIASSPERFAVASAEPGGNLRRFVYASATYPAMPADGPADAVTLAAGQDLSGLDFRLVSTPAVRVSGIVTGGTGNEFSGAYLKREARGVLPIAIGGAPYAQVESGGRFTFDAVPAGVYTLQVIKRPGQPGPLAIAERSLAVGSADIDGITLSYRPGPVLSGRIVFDGTEPAPVGESVRNTQIAIEPADSSTQELSSQVAVDSDGRFVMNQLLPGRYTLRAFADDRAWTLRSAMAAGKDLAAQPFDIVIGTDLRDVVLTFTDRQTSIEGTATAASATSRADICVVLFPVDQRQWVDYGHYSRRIIVVGADDRGQFIATPPPGDYYALATTSDLAEDWREAANLRRLSGIADRVSVSEGERLLLNLRARAIVR